MALGNSSDGMLVPGRVSGRANDMAEDNSNNGLPEGKAEGMYLIIPAPSTGSGDKAPNTPWQVAPEPFYGTEADLRAEYDNNKQTREVFEDYETYKAYATEAQESLESTTWWNSEGIDNRTRSEVIREGDDLGRSFSQSRPDDARQTDFNARKSGYQQWLMAPEQQALNEKYGIPTDFTSTSGDVYKWTGTGYHKVIDISTNPSFQDYAKAGITAVVAGGLGAGISTALFPAAGAATGTATGAGAIAAPGAVAASGGLLGGSIAQGAVGGGISSLISGALNGDLSLKGVLTGALTGGITGGFADLASSGALGNSIDNAIWDVSGVTGLDYETVSEIMGSVVTGVVKGEDLEGILMEAAGTAAGNLGKGWLNNTLGQSGLDVDNWFTEGVTNINTEALGTIVENVADAAGAGEIGLDDLGSGVLDYIDADGSFAFADPGIDIPNFSGTLGSAFDNLPDVDIRKGDAGFDVDDEGNITITGNVDFLPEDLPNVNIPDVDIRKGDAGFDVDDEGNITITGNVDFLPDVDVDVENPFSTPENPFSTPEVDLPEVDLPEVDFGGGGFNGGKFNPFYSGINYQPQQLQGLIQSRPVNAVSELQDIISRSLQNNSKTSSLFGEMI